MCPACDAFLSTVRFADGAAYLAQVAAVRAALADDVLEQVVGPALPLEDPRRPLRHAFACATCAHVFLLDRGGCDVSGDRWRALQGN